MRYFLILLFAFLTACGSTVPVVKPFKMDIQQGNVVTSKMLLQLKPGMTKSQVKFIMGTPLIVDSFHKDRWDYFYQLRQAGKIVEQRRVILDFDKDLLSKVRGDVVPEGTAGAATGNESSIAKTILVEPKPKQDEGMLDKLKFWKKDKTVKEVVKDKAVPEKVDAPQANSGKPAGDATSIVVPNVAAPNVNTPSTDTTSTDTPSVLAVPIGGIIATDAPAVETQAINAPPAEAVMTTEPVLEAPTTEAPVVLAPMVEALPVEPVKVEPVKAEASKVEMAAPNSAALPLPVPIPAAKAGEPLIFRMDRNLDLKNLQTSVEPSSAVGMPKIENNTVSKPKKIEPPIQPEEAPGYFERMLEKIGF